MCGSRWTICGRRSPRRPHAERQELCDPGLEVQVIPLASTCPVAWRCLMRRVSLHPSSFALLLWLRSRSSGHTRMPRQNRLRPSPRSRRKICRRAMEEEGGVDAVGTPITERPPHRTVRAAFPHTACMGVSLSRVHHAIFVVLCCFILLFDPRREHSSVPTAYYCRRRAQRRSRRLVLDQREHGGRLPVIGWSAAR